MSKYPKILVIAINAWREDATSHTLMNIFSCWQPENLAMIYTRSDLPNTKVCSHFFQISENDVLRSILKPWLKTGREVFNSSDNNSEAIQAEHERYAKSRKKHSWVLTICREIVWWLGHWKTKELEQFINEINPDVLFIPIYPTIYMGWIQRYIQKLTNKPFACYLADDNYSYKTCSGICSYIHRFFLRKQVRYLATHCNEMFVIVDKEKEETDRLFNTNSIILTKGLDFSHINYQEHILNKPLQFVYTGNLIIGRDKTLALLADIINEINKNGCLITLDIYSPDIVSNEIMKRLNNGYSKHRGFTCRDKVLEIQQKADVVVFAEALNGKERYAARLSFSTKITDYLSNGKCILAIGAKDIAPIDYFRKNDSAIIATSRDEIYKAVTNIISNPQMVLEYSKKSYECARRNFLRP